MHTINRRMFTGSLAGLSLSTLSGTTLLGGLDERFSFLVAGDTHYLANKESPSKIDATSARICGRLVDTLNRISEFEIDTESQRRRALEPVGMIHLGDIIDTGDKQGGVTSEMQKTEWSVFEEDFGLTGQEGRLRYPVYEVYGNHDSPHGKGWVIDKMIERNKRRPRVDHVSKNGLHYAWDWGGIRFICLGLIVGTNPDVQRKRRYAAMGSFEFLQTDLQERVGESHRPIVLIHHVDVARYCKPCDSSLDASKQEWDPCDVHAFYELIKNYNVCAIFYGHTHVRNVFRWEGTSKPSPNGIPILNADNASHFSGEAQAFFYVEVDKHELTIREFFTRDGWLSGSFAPDSWKFPLSRTS